MTETSLSRTPPARRHTAVRAQSWARSAAAALLLPAAFSACAGAAAGRGASAADQTAQAPADKVGAGRPTHTAADIEFVRGMIAHHRQALEMTALVPSHTRNELIHLLAERIEVSQTDEISQMSSWLQRVGEPLSSTEAHGAHQGHAESMPGMLTEEEMATLSAAEGAAFDRRFLELMIRHHEGALLMVGRLLATPGAGQDVDVYRMASEVDSDQRIEIERMQRMLTSLG